MVGIYKLTSPTGKIYIGQSWNVENRMGYYRSAACHEQPILYKSLKKHGYFNHTLQTITLPPDVSQAVLDQYEIFYINHYRDIGFTMLNMKEGGSRGKHLPETKAIVSKKRRLQLPPMFGKKHSEETKRLMSKSRIGFKPSLESIEKTRLKNTGIKLSEQTLQKLRDFHNSDKNHWLGRTHTQQTKDKMRLAKIGVKRKPMTDETKIRIGAANKLRYLINRKVNEK